MEYKAKDFGVHFWIDSEGQEIEEIRLENLENKIKILFCFQDWCPGCHALGFPSLKKIVDGLKSYDDIVFLAIQTVFEGFDVNTSDKLRLNQLKYDLKIPFGHDAGLDNNSQSIFMERYKTGGTPWFIIIDKKNTILFADFNINSEALITFIKTGK